MKIHAFFTPKTCLLLLVLLVALVIRAYQLGSVPHGLAWDEAAIGYNGYGILTTRRDEWLVKLPVSFKSFGDYKAPLAIYMNGFFTAVAGLTPFGIRLPFMIAGVLAVLGMFVLVQRLWQQADTERLLSEERKWWLALTGSLLLALSPWHIHYSRVAFESGLALSLLVWGVVGLELVLRPPQWVLRALWRRPALAGVTAVLLAASLYAYHSAKVTTPLIVGLFVLWSWRVAKQNWRWVIGTGVLTALLLIPLAQDTFNGQGGQRFTQTSIIGSAPAAEVMQTIAINLMAHLKPGFLLFGQTTTLRHGDGEWGVLLPTTFVGVLLGLVMLLVDLVQTRQQQWWARVISADQRLAMLALGWILVGLLPAALGSEIPHSNRALLALPGFLLLSLVGFDWLVRALEQHPERSFKVVGQRKLLAKTAVGMMLLIHILLAASYLNHYFTVFARLSAADFKDGYWEAMAYAVRYEKGQGVPKVQQVIFSNDYGHAYIYALLLRRTTPLWYQGGSLNTFVFTDQITPNDLQKPNTLVVASAEDDLPIEQAQYVVLDSNQQVRFKIFYNPPETQL